jgi:hypothetical protein
MITYENIIKDRVLDSLNTLIQNEFDTPVRWDEHKGNHSFLILPQSDSLDVIEANNQTRSYTVAIEYQVKKGGSFQLGDHIKLVTETTERLKRLLHNNSHYAPSDSYKWHDGGVSEITYEHDPEFVKSISIFNCTVAENL